MSKKRNNVGKDSLTVQQEQPVARIDVRVLEPLLRAIEAQTVRDGAASPSRWIALHLAEHFNIPNEDAVPRPKAMGRPRKQLAG